VPEAGAGGYWPLRVAWLTGSGSVTVCGGMWTVRLSGQQVMIDGSALFIHRLLRGVAIVVGPAPQSRGSARSEARTNDLDGGESVGDQLDLPAGGCEDGAVAITEDNRTPKAAAPSFGACRLGAESASMGQQSRSAYRPVRCGVGP
jgi:hypothetical protein